MDGCIFVMGMILLLVLMPFLGSIAVCVAVLAAIAVVALLIWGSVVGWCEARSKSKPKAKRGG